MNQQINMIAFYNNLDFSTGRNYVSASNSKVQYIIDVLNKSGYHVDIFSPCQSRLKNSKNGKFVFGNNALYFVSDCVVKNMLLRKISHFWFKLKYYWLLFWRIKKNSTVYAYHSLYYMSIIRILKRIKKITLILEVEEIYSDVVKDDKTKADELNFFQIADAYVFPSYLLNTQINKCRPYAIAHGIYNTDYTENQKFNDGKIHCIYAGTFSAIKGGVYNAINCGSYLDSQYHIHILGNGSDYDRKKVIDTINAVNLKSECKVSYDGFLTGQDLNVFMRKCDIGLSTQTPEGEYNDSSFPSKILTYLCNGLRVVTIKIPAITTSDISKLMYYYDLNRPEEIARAIKKIDVNKKYDSINIIKELDSKFQIELNNLITVKKEPSYN